MAKAKSGDTVRVEYEGRLSDGSVFDSSDNHGPLEFTLGEGKVISGFESAVEGMEVGESVTTTIAASDAYGPVNDDLKIDVPRGDFPDTIDPEVGQLLRLRQNDGRQIPVTVTEVTDEAVTIDANHPLAGQDLTFDIKLVEVA